MTGKDKDKEDTAISDTNKSSNSSSIINTSNPYYIHPSDHPGHVLVPSKLNGTNYSDWSKSILHALTAKNKIGFINGSIKPPSETEQPDEYALWNQCNSMILSWFANSVEPDLAKGVVHAKTAHQVWDDFKHQFSQHNAPTVYQIQKAIVSLSQGTMTVQSYFTQLKGLWDELETYQNLPACNQMTAHNGQREVDRLMQFLMGLNDTFNGVRSNILMMTPLPNVRQAYSIVNQDEKQRQMTSGSTENFSIAAAVQNRSNTFSHNFSNNSTNKHCSHCDRDGHTIDTCRTLKYYCSFCDKRGHTDDRCRNKRNGGNQGSKQHNKSQQQRGGNPRGSFHAANAADAGPVFLPQESQASTSAPLPNPLHSLSPEQLQQLAQAISTMATQNASGNSNAFANAAGLGYGEDDWHG